MGSKVVKTALDKNPLLKAKAEKFAKNAFESIKENLQNAKLDKNTRKALESIFNKELIKALDNRAFIVGDEGLKAFEKANKESLANLDIMARLKRNKESKMPKQTLEIQIQQGDFKTLKKNFDNTFKMLKNIDFINDETQIKAKIANTGIKEIISNVKKSIENGFTFNEHFSVAMNLKNVFKNANFIGKSKDLKHNDPNVNIYRFSSSVLFKQKQAKAILTLKEWKENGKRIYALKLEKLEKD